MYSRSFIYRIYKRLCYILTALYYKYFTNVKIGKNCKVEWSANIYGNIQLGDSVYIGKNVLLTGNITISNQSSVHNYTQITSMKNASIKIGKSCHIGNFNIIGSCKKLTIKDNALFAAGVKITNGNHGITENPNDIISKTPYVCEEMTIEENCWLAFDVNVIMGGQIGKNCIIGSKSLVNKAIPSNSIAVGIPAKVIKQRDTIEK